MPLVPLCLSSIICLMRIERRSTTDQHSRLAAALAARARAALSVDLTKSGRPITLPILHLRATADRLMSRGSADIIASFAADLGIRDASAPHFMFQVAPRDCAAIIAGASGGWEAGRFDLSRGQL